MGKFRKLLQEFDKGNEDVIHLDDVMVIVSREKGNNGYDLIHISLGDDIDIMKWIREGESFTDVPSQQKKRSNQTAGSRPYAMFFFEKIREKFSSPSCVGNVVVQKAAILDLSTCIEMGTGRLRKGWSKQHRDGDKSMNIKDIAEVIGKQERQAKTIVRDLVANGFLVKKSDGYYLDRKYILRGKSAEGKENT